MIKLYADRKMYFLFENIYIYTSTNFKSSLLEEQHRSIVDTNSLREDKDRGEISIWSMLLQSFKSKIEKSNVY